tara:strand:- start:197 stop:304 length:108 start_codon:yes stop_codon:yes gene_type:complete
MVERGRSDFTGDDLVKKGFDLTLVMFEADMISGFI